MIMTPYYEKPLATRGLTSYRYKGRYSWIMIGAKSNSDAIKEAARSMCDKSVPPSLDKLEVWDPTLKMYVGVTK